LRSLAWEVLGFGLKEARPWLFPALLVIVLFLSGYVTLGLARYGLIFLAAVAIQVALVAFRTESRDEVLALGAWSWSCSRRIPLLACGATPRRGSWRSATCHSTPVFMYRSVASYMCQAWKVMDLRLCGVPSCWLSVPLSVAIYLNFFTQDFLPDPRWVLALGVLAGYWRTKVQFTTTRRRSIPLVLAFGLMGFFVYAAENVSTYLGAWAYPDQLSSWNPVALAKISSRTLLAIVSFAIVADLKHARAGRRERRGF
jgi:uncharacterized membrane protein YoaT (DUF817 family)